MKLEDLAQTDEQANGIINPFYISFSDLMVLLCVFFVMMLGMSKVKMGSFEQLRSGFSGSTKGTLLELARDLKSTAKNLPGVSVQMAEDGVRLNLQSAALFNVGSAVVKRNSLSRLQSLFTRIKKTNYTIDIEGHTDDQPLYKRVKTSEGIELETNWSLSGRRAASVINHLASLGFQQKRLRVVGYAATRPQKSIRKKYGVELNRARSLNRRVSILVH